MKHFAPVNCKNDTEMVNAGLRPPVLNIDRSVFVKEKQVVKNQPVGFLREEMLDIIVRSNPRFNVVLKVK